MLWDAYLNQMYWDCFEKTLQSVPAKQLWLAMTPRKYLSGTFPFHVVFLLLTHPSLTFWDTRTLSHGLQGVNSVSKPAIILQQNLPSLSDPTGII
jgi:hypothetical protein